MLMLCFVAQYAEAFKITAKKVQLPENDNNTIFWILQSLSAWQSCFGYTTTVLKSRVCSDFFAAISKWQRKPI